MSVPDSFVESKFQCNSTLTSFSIICSFTNWRPSTEALTEMSHLAYVHIKEFYQRESPSNSWKYPDYKQSAKTVSEMFLPFSEPAKFRLH